MIKLILFILLFIGCGSGTINVDNNYPSENLDNTRAKSESKEMIIYRNVSKEIFTQFMPKAISAESYEILSSYITCKNINSNYTTTNNQYQQNHYVLNGLLGCSDYDLSNTEFKGNATYLVTLGSLKTEFTSDSPPILHSVFSSYLKKHTKRAQAKPILVDYDKEKMKSNIYKSWFVYIARNTTKAWILTRNERSTKSFIYDLPLEDRNITCEEFGFILQEEELNNKIYKIYHEKTIDACYDISTEDNTKEYGNKTYVLTVLKK